MLVSSHGLAVLPPRGIPLSATHFDRERERLRRELLRRIVARESKRQSLRGPLR